MDYIYDIVLNFQNKYYDFYEWKKTDKLINIKKILVYKVNNKDYLDLKYNDVIIDKNITSLAPIITTFAAGPYEYFVNGSL